MQMKGTFFQPVFSRLGLFDGIGKPAEDRLEGSQEILFCEPSHHQIKSGGRRRSRLKSGRKTTCVIAAFALVLLEPTCGLAIHG